MQNEDIRKALDDYRKIFPHEKNDFSALQKQLGEEASVLTRGNLYGHVTASGIVLYHGKILLIFHNKLQKYLQPGGHVDTEDQSLWEAAQREILEETGMNTALHSWYTAHAYIPFHINTHIIPFQPKTGEPEHFHHDFAFLFVPKNPDDGITLQHEEVSDYQWLPCEEKFSDGSLKEIAQKIIRLNLNSD